MIVVTIELWSAITGKKTLLGKAVISNDGSGNEHLGNYDVAIGRKGQADITKICHRPKRWSKVLLHQRLRYDVWYLLRRGLTKAGY